MTKYDLFMSLDISREPARAIFAAADNLTVTATSQSSDTVVNGQVPWTPTSRPWS